jgi:alpha-ribazole phosphatase
MELYFVRHIQPAIESGICYGQLDVPLPEGYEAQHLAVKEAVKEAVNDTTAVYTSPLQRCRLMAEALSPSPVVDDRLMELHFGEWEGKAWNAIDRKLLDIWGDNYITIGPPRGESLSMLVDRLRAFLDDLQKQNYEKVVIVTHAGIIRAAMHLLKDKPLTTIMSEKVNYGSIYTFNL